MSGPCLGSPLVVGLVAALLRGEADLAPLYARYLRARGPCGVAAQLVCRLLASSHGLFALPQRYRDARAILAVLGSTSSLTWRMPSSMCSGAPLSVDTRARTRLNLLPSFPPSPRGGITLNHRHDGIQRIPARTSDSSVQHKSALEAHSPGPIGPGAAAR